MSVEFANDWMSYITLKGCWCDIRLNVPGPTEDKIDDIMDRFDEELKHWSHSNLYKSYMGLLHEPALFLIYIRFKHK
ncbi:hypothetical protein B7P43_G02063 [Cryptotermes secundus]|uniref:Uncharacterized protein n=1 Tax=Cryptotermes secundus TaxID=105785 RepID=A0A2J7QQX1_9NEOP|nr:hypothetical protein B7P43_G02063 [Cryptotermes secundus]